MDFFSLFFPPTEDVRAAVQCPARTSGIIKQFWFFLTKAAFRLSDENNLQEVQVAPDLKGLMRVAVSDAAQ